MLNLLSLPPGHGTPLSSQAQGKTELQLQAPSEVLCAIRQVNSGTLPGHSVQRPLRISMPTYSLTARLQEMDKIQSQHHTTTQLSVLSSLSDSPGLRSPTPSPMTPSPAQGVQRKGPGAALKLT